MLSQEQIEQFEETGVLRLPTAFEPDAAAAMEDRVWEALKQKDGVERGDRSTWTLGQACHLQPLADQPEFAAIGSPTLLTAIDQLLGVGRWKRPRHWGQFLVNFPSPGPWTLPWAMWHTDFGLLEPRDRPFGLVVFSYLADVQPRSGGTVVVEGSHHLIRRFVEGRPGDASLGKMKVGRKAFLQSDPWLGELTSERDGSGRNAKFMDQTHDISGISLRVTELTGQAGDIVLTHPWVLHCPAPNCGTAPRMMRIQRVRLGG